MIRRLLHIAALVLISIEPAIAQSMGDDLYIQTDEAGEYDRPSEDARKINTLYRRERVHVYSMQGTWARVSDLKFAPAWVDTKLLGPTAPPEKPLVESPAIFSDARIQNGALPLRPQWGLNVHDVEMIWRAARKALDSGCKEIDNGDSDPRVGDQYYVHCVGEGANRFYSGLDLTH
jgi:hypothetical protein